MTDGVPYHCSTCEVGWRGPSHSPQRCEFCGEFGEQGAVAEKVLHAPNRTIIEQEKLARGEANPYPYLGNRLVDDEYHAYP